MASLGEFWSALKPILEVGAVGAIAVLMFMVWFRKDKENKRIQEARVEEQKEAKREVLQLQSLYTREIAEITRHYNLALTNVAVLMERIADRLEE